MPDMSQIEQELNSDPAVKDRFLQDPAGFLEQRGIALPPEQAENLRDQVQRSRQQFATAGIHVGVTVGT